VISPVKLSPYPKCWSLTFDEKKAVYGKMRLPVGGKTDESDDDDDGDGLGEGEVPPTIDMFTESSSAATPAESPAKKLCTRAGTNVEPVNYNSLPTAFFENLHDAFCIKDLVDFTPVDGACAMAFIRARKGYIGICWNDVHADKLRQYLIDTVVNAFGTSGDVLFHSAYASGVKNTPAPKSPPKPIKPKKSSVPKSSKKAKKDKKDKKVKKTVKSGTTDAASSSSSSSSDSGSSA
jgi:hypothetical protein